MNIDVMQFSKPCTCGREHKIEVEQIIIESGAVKKLEKMMEEGRFSQYKNPIIVCDENTYQATAQPMQAIYNKYQKVLLPAENLHANNHGVDILLERLSKEADLLFAVGAGTVHDLTRYVAYERKIPFLSVPTAASVDGFVSTVAAMTWNGMKKTMPAQAPVCVIADTDIFSKAPYRLTASGISDLFGKYIALADWKIAHLLTGEYICERVCQMEMDALAEVRQCLDGLQKGQADAYEKLMYALLLSGLAMQMIGNSRPASCAEHHVSHLWEMEIINDYVDALHGEKVSIGLMLCTEKYRKIAEAIRLGKCKVKPYPGMEMSLLSDTFGRKGLLDAAIEENTPDPMGQVKPAVLESALFQIADIIEELPGTEELLRLLKKGGCVSSVKEVGLTEDIIEPTMCLSPYVRNRLSFNRVSKMLEYEA